MTRANACVRFTALTLSVALSLPLLAGHPIGKPSGGGASIEWLTTISGYEKIELSVLNPDYEPFARTFSAGQSLLLPLSAMGELAIDGVYTYELRVVPKIPADVKRKLIDARADDNPAKVRAIMRRAGLGQPVTQSGAFSVVSGAIVQPDAEESSHRQGASGTAVPGTTTSSWTPAANAQVIDGDLVVHNSLCVGFDCLSGETFGFDTILLKENNLRIRFDDTSAPGAFPSTDWQLTANDSTSGGLNRFSVDDLTSAHTPMTIVGGAPNNALFVGSSGRIGLRTGAPVLDVHISATDSPAVRLEQNNSGGWPAQTWDLAGNEANFFVRDVTGGSKLPFRIRPGAPTSSIDISAAGDVGVGTSSPGARLHVVGNIAAGALMRLQNLNAAGFGGISILDNAGVARMFVGVDNAATTSRIASFSTNPLLLVTSNIERARITPTGSLGIGLTNPSSKLHVSGGDIRVTGGSFIDDGTTLSVPDYVFDDGYELMPLGELATYVREEKHLPNVPGRSELKSEGLNLGEFQMRLLEKVEELTLYALAQHEEIGGLRAQNEELRRHLAELEKTLARER